MNRKIRRYVPVLFLIYLVLLVWIIVFKLQFSISDLDSARSINLIPFHHDKEVGMNFYIKEILDNLLIFVPIGIYLQMLLFNSKFLIKLLAIVCTSLLLEVTQYLLAVGRSDITDLLTNTAGGLLGIALYGIVARLLKKQERTDTLFFILATVTSVLVIGLLAFVLLANC